MCDPSNPFLFKRTKVQSYSFEMSGDLLAFICKNVNAIIVIIVSTF